jgi:N-acetylmuramic acid 6-phosphate etherase
MLTTSGLVDAMNQENELVAHAVAAKSAVIAQAIDGIVSRLKAGGRLIYVGAGTAGRIGVLDASEIPPTFGTDPKQIVGLIAGGEQAIREAVEDAEDDWRAGETDLEAISLSGVDAVVGISASGRTPYVIGALRRAKQEGALTVALACNEDSEIGSVADIAIETVVGPELLTGSTRLKSGTAQKLITNMITTLTMIKLGKSYQNLMVDLRATNEKLRARAERTVMLATDADPETAANALSAVDGWVKAAILMIETELSGPDAVRRLEANGGYLRQAITDAQGQV